MNNVIELAKPRGAAITHRAELTSRAVLRIVADAWSRYPFGVLLPRDRTDDQDLVGQVLGLLAREGLVRMPGNVISLTESGCKAIQQASRKDHRLAKFLEDGTLPAEESGSSSLVLAILHAHHEQQSAPIGKAFRSHHPLLMPALPALMLAAFTAGPADASDPEQCAAIPDRSARLKCFTAVPEFTAEVGA